MRLFGRFAEALVPCEIVAIITEFQLLALRLLGVFDLGNYLELIRIFRNFFRNLPPSPDARRIGRPARAF